MMAHVELTRRAALDLAEIEQYSIERWGRRVASQYLDAFNQAVKLLQEHPSLLRDKDEISQRFSFYRVERHFLVCAVIEDNIHIVAVLHGSRDLPDLVAELEPHLIEEAELLHRRFLQRLDVKKKKSGRSRPAGNAKSERNSPLFALW